jgi:hypothetical protein
MRRTLLIVDDHRAFREAASRQLDGPAFAVLSTAAPALSHGGTGCGS